MIRASAAVHSVPVVSVRVVVLRLRSSQGGGWAARGCSSRSPSKKSVARRSGFATVRDLPSAGVMTADRWLGQRVGLRTLLFLLMTHYLGAGR